LAGLLWGIIVVLVVVYLLSLLAFHVSSGLIHVLIVIAIILVIYNLMTGRGARV
jgi:hypothetical protein